MSPSNIEWEDSIQSNKNNINKPINEKLVFKKASCRYGRGCTHINDPLHLERFYHPPVPVLDPDCIKNNYICSECGFAFSSLTELRYHLLKKTAWSNTSLVGCRISCLLDNKEWHEGEVTQYHKSGKHSVEFRTIGEKRWLLMSKMAFYIIERSVEPMTEYKENEDGTDNNNNSNNNNNGNNNNGVNTFHSEEESWSYTEDISIEYAFAQSVLFKIYGGVVQETGHKTKGHLSLTDGDREIAKNMKGSLLYGELLSRGVNKALDSQHLDAASHTVLYELGMGTGKVLIQAFLQFRNLKYLFGIELSAGRYMLAEEAALKMVNLLGKDSFDIQLVSGSYIKITEKLINSNNIVDPDEKINPNQRVLHMVCGDMFTLRDIDNADIIMLETEVPQDLHAHLCKLLSRMKDGAQTLTYHDIRKIWTLGMFPYKQLDINRHLTDRYPTSWSVQRGHHFFLWRKVHILTPSSFDKSSSEPTSNHSISQPYPTHNDTYSNSKNNYDDDRRIPSSSYTSTSTRNRNQQVDVVSTGCSSFSIFRSFIQFFRRRSVSEHENDKVIPVNDIQPCPPNLQQSLGIESVVSIRESQHYSSPNSINSIHSKSQTSSSPNNFVKHSHSLNCTSIVGSMTTSTQHISHSDHNLSSTIGKSALSSLVQPLTSSNGLSSSQSLPLSPSQSSDNNNNDNNNNTNDVLISVSSPTKKSQTNDKPKQPKHIDNVVDINNWDSNQRITTRIKTT